MQQNHSVSGSEVSGCSQPYREPPVISVTQQTSQSECAARLSVEAFQAVLEGLERVLLAMGAGDASGQSGRPWSAFRLPSQAGDHRHGSQNHPFIVSGTAFRGSVLNTDAMTDIPDLTVILLSNFVTVRIPRYERLWTCTLPDPSPALRTKLLSIALKGENLIVRCHVRAFEVSYWSTVIALSSIGSKATDPPDGDYISSASTQPPSPSCTTLGRERAVQVIPLRSILRSSSSGGSDKWNRLVALAGQTNGGTWTFEPRRTRVSYNHELYIDDERRTASFACKNGNL